MSALPFSREAEEQVIGRLLQDPGIISEVLTVVRPSDFYIGASRVLMDEIVAAHYDDMPIDPLTIAERTAKKLAKGWDSNEVDAVKRVLEWGGLPGDTMDHAALVKRHADYRALLRTVEQVQQHVAAESKDPDEIAGQMGEEAMRIATDSVSMKDEIVSFADAGRNFIRTIREEKAAVDAGLQLGVNFGMRFIDDYTNGLRPGELLIAAGEPGVGKSMVWWRASQLYAETESKRAFDQQMGTLIVSCEMGQQLSNMRVATAITGIDSGKIRRGDLRPADFERIVAEWGRRKAIPLWFNFRPNLRLSQLRTIITEAIRRHNVGYVLIDHFRHLDTDRYVQDSNERDEIRARFLKEQIAESLNVAVVCIAHSVKMTGDNKRPGLSALRGSGQIAAAADIVSFIYRPYLYASEAARNKGEVSPTEAELIFAKNRNGEQDVSEFTFDPATITVY